MKYLITYYRHGKPRRYRFPTLGKAIAYASRVFDRTGQIVGIEEI